MKPLTTIALILTFAAGAGAQEAMFAYDPNRTQIYFDEALVVSAPESAPAGELAELAQVEVRRLIERDWGPLGIHSVPVNEKGRTVYFNCPDELLTALALALPTLDEPTQAAAREFARAHVRRYFPVTTPARDMDSGDRPRGWYDPPEQVMQRNGYGRWLPTEFRRRVAFKTLYGVWAYAHAFDDWELIRQAWPTIRELREHLDRENYDFTPQWKDDQAAELLTEAVAGDPRYRHRLLRYLYYGTHGFYGHNWPRDLEHANVFMQFNYTKLLSALIGYGRIADRLGHDEDAQWARDMFEHVAAQTLTYKTAPYYWSSPWLTPEVARMLRDHAGDWLDDLADDPSVFVGDQSHGFVNDGPWYQVMDQHHWWVTHLGANGAATPDAPMSGFMTHAWLFGAEAQDLDTWTDIPWCQADYWYIQKCAVAINAYGGELRWANWRR